VKVIFKKHSNVYYIYGFARHWIQLRAQEQEWQDARRANVGNR